MYKKLLENDVLNYGVNNTSGGFVDACTAASQVHSVNNIRAFYEKIVLVLEFL